MIIGELAHSGDLWPTRRDCLRLEAELGLPADMIEPVDEGARAHGMADAFEAMGRAVVFLDGAGTVLYAAPSAQQLFGSTLALAGHQLMATSPDGNAILQSLVGDGLEGRCAAADLPEDCDSGGRLRLSVRPGPVPGSPNQLLRAILFLDLLPAGIEEQGTACGRV